MIPPGAGRFVLGDRVQLKVAAEETGGVLSLFQGFTPPGKGPPLHRHENEDECFVVLSGRYEMLCGPLRSTARVGDCVFLPRRIPHTFRNCGRRPARLLELVVPGGLERYFEAVNILGPETTAGLDRRNEIGRPFGISFPAPGADVAAGDADGQGRFVLRDDRAAFELGSSSARWSMPPDATGGRIAMLDVDVAPGGSGRIAPSPGGQRVIFVRAGSVEMRCGGSTERLPRGGVLAAGSGALRWLNAGTAPASLLIGCVSLSQVVGLSVDDAAA